MNGKHLKHDFLRRVVRLCLIMMVIMTLTTVIIAIVRGEPISDGALGILMGGWCGELLLTLLKRKFEVDDNKRNAKAEEENANSVRANGFEINTEEGNTESWNSGQ